jgi:plastocyanin
MRKFFILLVVLVLAVPFTVSAAPPTQAHVHFGDENAGSPFSPELGHDQSFHAADKMVPRTVVISQGGSVTFSITPAHQVAIYGPGTKPGDINLHPDFLDDVAVPFPPFIIPDILINYPVGRVALAPAPNLFEHTTWTTPAGTFDEPGRYLVICTILPHFAGADMYGWVIVQ